mmetsp:Transcript_95150/g.308095  ORF Transcript_95150/g.308095 Transcript_95150/m.308095 type:complete len:243 (+) Transcript_95150:101-829(+)
MTAEIRFDQTPFAEGGFKLVFRARVIKGTYEGFPVGTECVVKFIKPELRRQGIRLSEKDIEMQDEAKRLVDLWMSTVGPTENGHSCHAHMRVARLSHLNGGRMCGTHRMSDGEAFIVERMINGEFEKFNSNSGWSCGNAWIPDALSHWSWVQTEGSMLLCDLQGHRGRPGGPSGSETYYMFTDPAIMTPRGRFGSTDLGQEGIETFFAYHKCNDLCMSLGLVGNIPAQRAHLARRRGSAWRQ